MNRFIATRILTELVKARAAHGVNLKLAKLGGPVSAMALAARARAAGMRLMAGAMVETRVGLLAMAHVVAALGGVDWVDLDTAFLLAAICSLRGGRRLGRASRCPMSPAWVSASPTRARAGRSADHGALMPYPIRI